MQNGYLKSKNDPSPTNEKKREDEENKRYPSITYVVYWWI